MGLVFMSTNSKKPTYQSECPAKMIAHIYERSFDVDPEKMSSVWTKLNLRETFTEGQIFPYHVEFDSFTQKGPFAQGELNIHHGPLLSVHGAIGEINQNYRSLDYFFGSYVISFRLVRPIKLEFFKESNKLRLKLTCYLNPWFQSIWELGNNFFWKLFGINFLFKN